MSDICERLQVCVDSEDGYWPTILAKEAIKEIRRLREEVEAYKQTMENEKLKPLR